MEIENGKIYYFKFSFPLVKFLTVKHAKMMIQK